MVGHAEELQSAHEGHRFGRYLLRQRLARGGMASVYLAQLSGAHGFEKWVAVKVVHPHLAEDRRFVQMFLDEARLASRIHHQNVCQVLDFGEQDGTAYLVMEYLHGETLASVVRRAVEVGAPIWLTVRAVVDAARGLHAAHDLSGLDGHPLGLVHRDVSPQNILCLYDGLSKVMDFGVARARGRMADTSASELKGKIAYMSPEQLEQRPVDRRTDIWALGVLLWETTVRRRLFRGDNEGATALNVINREVPRPSYLVDSYSAILEEVVMTALERDPDRRFATAAELADALESYLYSVGRPTGHAQVAQWMHTAFGERRDQRDQMLRLAATATPRIDTDALVSSHSSLGSMPSAARRSHIARRKRGRLPLIAAAVALFLLGGAGAWGASKLGLSLPGLEAPPAEPTEVALAGSTEPAPAPVDPAPSEAASADSAAEEVVVVEEDPPAPTEEPVAEAPPVAEAEAPQQRARTTPRAVRSPVRQKRVARIERAEPATEPERGTLNLLAIPAAEVTLGGRPIGRTPLVNHSLPAGQHLLTLRPLEGGPTKRVVVRIRSGENTRASVSLAR